MADSKPDFCPDNLVSARLVANEQARLMTRLEAMGRQQRDLQADKRVLHDELEHMRQGRAAAIEGMAHLRRELLKFRDSLHDGSQYYAEGIKAALDSIIERHCE